MRFLVYSDLQATSGNERSFTEPGKTLQQLRVERFFEMLLRVYTENNCDGLIDLGDTTDDRSAIPLPTIEALGHGLSLFPNNGRHFKLTGNHEQFLRSTRVSNRHLFSHMFHVVEGNEVIDLDGWQAAFCSYPAEMKHTCDWLSQFRAGSSASLLFGHFTVAGCIMAGGQPSASGVPLEFLKPFSAGLLGHIHKPQTLRRNIHYLGSPFQQNWGEAGEGKRVAIVDTRATNADSVIRWVPLEGFPSYVSMPFGEFKHVSDIGEDRIRVVISNLEESEEFLQHALFHQVEPVYACAETHDMPSAVVTPEWTPTSACIRYLKNTPPSQFNVEAADEEMLEMAQMIVDGDV